MNLAGASRRSAAPASQSVGVAEYGAGPLALSRIPEVQAAKMIPLSTADAAASECPVSRHVGHMRKRVSAQPRPSAAVPARQQPRPLHAVSFAQARRPFTMQRPRSLCSQASPTVPKLRANHSVKPTRSGLRPPRAAYLNR